MYRVMFEDESNPQKLLMVFQLADTLGTDICILKTHIDVLSDFTDEVSMKLKGLAQKHNFIILEDR